MATNELSRSTLLRKDRDELLTIAKAMGAKPASRSRKAQIVDLILEMAGVNEDEDNPTETDKSEEEAPQSGETKAADKGSNDEANGTDSGGEAESDNANRRRRRRRGRDRDGDQHDTEPVKVEGFLDLRDDGYGFLRVDGAAPSRQDVYVSVKQVRTNGLRKGDHLTGTARPANRNEKNPAMVTLESINGGGAEESRDRPRFDELTAVFPSEVLNLEIADDPTARAISLLAPMGKGQRGLVVGPPRSGKTAVIKSIGAALRANHPDLTIMVVLIDERPEDVTDVARAIDGAEIVSSGFDRGAEEHVMVAEMAFERAKRRVEAGEHLVILFDGLSRLARAANLSGNPSGRTMPGGIDSSAVLAPKRLFGAARNIEAGGSLTVLATVSSGTGSVVDELIAGEVVGAANQEIRLDRTLATQGVLPAIDAQLTESRATEHLLSDAERIGLTAVREAVDSPTGIQALLQMIDQNRTNEGLTKSLL